MNSMLLAFFAIGFHFLWDVNLKELKTTEKKLLPLYLFIFFNINI